MAIRKGFKVNVKSNVNSTKTDTIFLDLKEDEARRVRFLPPAREDGALFTKVVQHFKLKTDDDPPRGMAVACNSHFKDEDCYLCNLSKTLKRDGDKAEKRIGDDIRASVRFYAQVMVAEKMEDGTLEYHGPKLLGLPKTAVEDVNAILLAEDMAGDDFFCDVEKGQDLIITRTGKGFQTKYSAQATGQKNNLDEVYPGWEEKFIEDVEEELGLNFKSNEEMRAAAVRTYADDLDWDALRDYNL
jgi:hypothetical protein